MRVLVTGHKGYIGVILTPMLEAAGHEVYGLDNDMFRRCTFGGSIPSVTKETIKDIRDVEAADARVRQDVEVGEGVFGDEGHGGVIAGRPDRHGAAQAEPEVLHAQGVAAPDLDDVVHGRQPVHLEAVEAGLALAPSEAAVVEGLSLIHI